MNEVLPSYTGSLIGRRLNRDQRILDLIRQAGTTDFVEKELARIKDESQRYDGGCSVNNTTVYPGSFALHDNFRLKWVGWDQIGGSEVAIIDYREVGSSMIELSTYYKRMGLSAVFARGRLWLDATTSQLRQERAEIDWSSPGRIGTGYDCAPAAGKYNG